MLTYLSSSAGTRSVGASNALVAMVRVLFSRSSPSVVDKIATSPTAGHVAHNAG